MKNLNIYPIEMIEAIVGVEEEEEEQEHNW